MKADSLYGKKEQVKNIKDCYFYHVMDIPGYGEVGDEWDLRGGVDEYLGHTKLKGKRVLEIGPASGYLTFHMESKGADVVGVELGPTADWDVVPHKLINKAAVLKERRGVMKKIRNGFWFAHERFNSKAKVHYGSIYSLPAKLGRFDIALMGSVLLHTRDPLKVMEECAKLSDQMVITERFWAELEGSPVCRLYPDEKSSQWDTWWEFSSDIIVQYLKILGFKSPKVTFHNQIHVHEGKQFDMPMFTVVAKR